MTSIFVKRHFEAGVLLQNRLCEAWVVWPAHLFACERCYYLDSALWMAIVRFGSIRPRSDVAIRRPYAVSRDYADIHIKSREWGLGNLLIPHLEQTTRSRRRYVGVCCRLAVEPAFAGILVS
jgi:hypothetical protein